MVCFPRAFKDENLCKKFMNDLQCSYQHNAMKDRKMIGLFIAGLILISAPWAKSLKCYQCSNCNTVTDDDLVECPSTAQACFTVSIYEETSRSCSAQYRHSGCRDERSEFGIPFTTCYCNSNGCNDNSEDPTTGIPLVSRLSTATMPKDSTPATKETSQATFLNQTSGTSAKTTVMTETTKTKSLKCYQCSNCNTVTDDDLVECPSTAQACFTVSISGDSSRVCSTEYPHSGCRDESVIGIQFTNCYCNSSGCNGNAATTIETTTTTRDDADKLNDLLPQLIKGFSDILKTVSDMLRLLGNKLN